MRRIPLPSESLYPLRTLAFSLGIYGVATLAQGSGFLAVFVAGIVIGDPSAPFKREIRQFHSALAGIAEIVAFVVLGLTISLQDVAAPGHLARRSGPRRPARVRGAPAGGRSAAAHGASDVRGTHLRGVVGLEGRGSDLARYVHPRGRIGCRPIRLRRHLRRRPVLRPGPRRTGPDGGRPLSRPDGRRRAPTLGGRPSGPGRAPDRRAGTGSRRAHPPMAKPSAICTGPTTCGSASSFAMESPCASTRTPCCARATRYSSWPNRITKRARSSAPIESKIEVLSG